MPVDIGGVNGWPVVGSIGVTAPVVGSTTTGGNVGGDVVIVGPALEYARQLSDASSHSVPAGHAGGYVPPDEPPDEPLVSIGAGVGLGAGIGAGAGGAAGSRWHFDPLHVHTPTEVHIIEPVQPNVLQYGSVDGSTAIVVGAGCTDEPVDEGALDPT